MYTAYKILKSIYLPYLFIGPFFYDGDATEEDLAMVVIFFLVIGVVIDWFIGSALERREERLKRESTPAPPERYVSGYSYSSSILFNREFVNPAYGNTVDTDPPVHTNCRGVVVIEEEEESKPDMRKIRDE